jgi:TonB family protein
MKPDLNFLESALTRTTHPVAAPTFLVSLDPWHKVFLRNLGDLVRLRRQVPLNSSSTPAPFWDDVFVKSPLPWARFAESAIFHSAVIAALWGSARMWPQKQHLAPAPVFHSSDVITYDLSEYLPPLDTGNSTPTFPLKGDPVYAPQPIISVPPESDNRRQTIVTPPDIKLNRDVPLPNIVAWARPAPAVPAAATSTRASDLRLPALQVPAIAPPPQVNKSKLQAVPVLPPSVVAPAPEVASQIRRADALPQQAVIAPPPGIEMAAMRTASDINIGRAEIVAPAPQLPVEEQHPVSSLSRGALGNSPPAVVAPPPAIEGPAGVRPEGRVIALSVQPAPPSAPVEVPAGNRRGSFAATPEGKPDSSATPEVPHNTSRTEGARAANAFSKQISGVPPGLFVGARPGTEPASTIGGQSEASDPKPLSGGDSSLMARAMSPRTLAAELSPEQQNETERKIFGIRKSYAMTVTVPNLNLAGGSLVMHFSELKDDEKQGDLFAPVITHAVAPGYPLELMRENVQGTVELSAVIRSDGSVGEVRVLNEVDDRLEAYARDALLRWQFLPALRNGNPVPLQAVVKIPFKARNIRF